MRKTIVGKQGAVGGAQCAFHVNRVGRIKESLEIMAGETLGVFVRLGRKAQLRPKDYARVAGLMMGNLSECRDANSKIINSGLALILKKSNMSESATNHYREAVGMLAAHAKAIGLKNKRFSRMLINAPKESG
jgi:hypothetical protein